MTEQQPYTVIREGSGYELRHYPACVVAEVVIRADFDSAGSLAFRPLVAYIGGANQSRTPIAMTAPVIQNESLAMTAPVLQAAGDDGEYVVAFVLPSTVTMESAPIPTDPRVRLRQIPESTTAATRYSGRWSRSAYLAKVEELLAALAMDGLTPKGEPRFARFDPPFKPWFLRRNEVQIDVESA
ncbi:MAG: hypothetical protein RJB01_285 [Actinomycetota bacterium]